MRFEGKVAVITAAGAGIGRATTDILVKEGATVVAVEIDQARIDNMASALTGEAGAVDGRCIDAMDEDGVTTSTGEKVVSKNKSEGDDNSKISDDSSDAEDSSHSAVAAQVNPSNKPPKRR